MSDRYCWDFRSQIVFWFKMIIISMVTSIFEKNWLLSIIGLDDTSVKTPKKLMVFGLLEFIFWVFRVKQLLPTAKKNSKNTGKFTWLTTSFNRGHNILLSNQCSFERAFQKYNHNYNDIKITWTSLNSSVTVEVVSLFLSEDVLTVVFWVFCWEPFSGLLKDEHKSNLCPYIYLKPSQLLRHNKLSLY